MDPGKIFQIITNSTLLATRLLSGSGVGPLEFAQPRYCAVVSEDAQIAATVAVVVALHKQGEGVHYTITRGNKEGLFTIHEDTGVITVAATLDYELHEKHELVVAAKSGVEVVQTVVQVLVADVNDNTPEFLRPNPQVTVIEEDDRDLPLPIAKVEARDLDWLDNQELLYTLRGDGIDGYAPDDAFFTINSRTGQLIQLRALDRDPPSGKGVWKVRVQVRDGQAPWDRLEDERPSHLYTRYPRSAAGGGGKATHQHTHTNTHPLPKDNVELRRRQKDTRIENEVEKYSKRNKTPEGVYTIEENDRFSMNNHQESINRLVKRRDVRREDNDLRTKVIGTAARQGCQGSHNSNLTSYNHQMNWKEQIKQHRRYGHYMVSSVPTASHNAGDSHDLRQTKDRYLPSTSFYRPRLRGMTDWPQHEPQGTRVKSKGSRIKGAYPTGDFPVLRAKYQTHPNVYFKSRLTGKSSDTAKRRRPSNLYPRFRSSSIRLLRDAVSIEDSNAVLPTRSERDRKVRMGYREEYLADFRSRSARYLGGLKMAPDKKVIGAAKTSVERTQDSRSGKQEERHVTVSRRSPTFVPLPFRPPQSRPSNSSSRKKVMTDNKRYQAYTTSFHKTLDLYHTIIGLQNISEALTLLKAATRPGFEGHRTTSRPQLTGVKRSMGVAGLRLTSAPRWPGSHIVNIATGSHLPRDSDSTRNNNTSSPKTSIRRKRTVESLLYDSGDFGRFLAAQEEEEEKEEEEEEGCKDFLVYSSPPDTYNETSTGYMLEGKWRGGRVHVMETMVTVVVKDINDNAPTFPNTTMFGEVQENGPIDLSVAVVSAWDADDAIEGTNARLTYSIEKNVIDEKTGEAIFAVHPETGLVRTALCCLDRETTPEYNIQVVASDGGGLKGTGTVVVRLADVNDNSPRLARQQWDLKVQETWGKGPPSNATILEIAASDRDTANYFYYRVVESSGWGWQHFGIRTVGAVGQLYARKTLDYEDQMHRQGFRFMVQVTDRGRGGWKDPRHLDSAWVSVRLRDINDNPPQFSRPQTHVTVREDTAPGTLLASLAAHDPDMGGKQKVDYHMKGGWGALRVDTEGGVSLWRTLDREAPDGETGVAKIIAVDHGHPSLTSTATLTITVTDVNDCAPQLLPPSLLHVTEGAPPALLGVLTATDYDVWALGHGPPFNLTLLPTNPAHVLAHIKLKFDPHLDSGRGGAELWTLGAVDREEHPQLLVEVLVTDAGGVAATQIVTVVIDDINDNPMKPAAKTVYLWKTQGGGSDAPLGRVYVDDPDDWDVGDKSYQWVGPPHPLFSLNTHDGTIFASSQVREGRYELHFSVSDRVWRQREVSANVTVAVKLLTQDSLAHATPITLAPTTPTQLTRGWTPTRGGGGLGRLVEGVLRVVGGEGDNTVEVVSVYGHNYQHHHHHHHHPLPPPQHSPDPNISSFFLPTATSTHKPHKGTKPFRASTRRPPLTPSSSVWVSVRGPGGVFMDPVKLQGLLGLHSRQLEAATNLTVHLESSGIVERRLEDFQHPDLHNGRDGDPSSAASLASTALPLQVVDTNATSLVTPRLSHGHACHAHEPETCTPTSCLNGGRCVWSSNGNRCLCPGGSKGWQCKVLSRTFSGSGWAWVRPLPPCLPTTISLRLLTRRPHALILYSGPMAPQSRPSGTPLAPTPMLALQLKHGHPQLLFEGGLDPLKLEVNTSVHDGAWHTLHVHLDTQSVALMVDLCGRGWEPSAHDDAHCLARAAWTTPWDLERWLGSGPLEVGGLAHSPPTAHDHGWQEAPSTHPMDGCISHLTLNSQLVDLGEPAYSRGSKGGCQPQELACPGGLGGCGQRGECVGGLKQPECQCEAGWTGPGCSTPTIPAALGKASYMKVALSFTPAPKVVRVQLRVRSRGARHGLLLHLAAHHRAAAFTLHLQASAACASFTGSERVARMACVEGRPLGDGVWHTIVAERHGDNLIVSVDDGDGWRRNETLHSLLVNHRERRGRGREPPTSLDVDKHDGVTVGGLPEFVGMKLVGIREDLTDTCIDDLRLSGRHLPLPPAINGTSWGQVTTLQNLERGCTAPDTCANITCTQPLSCTTNWGQATCSCGPGHQLVDRTCEDVDECLWRPCLHGGSCYNLRPGYLCLCGPGHTGDHCQWTTLTATNHSLTAPFAIAALTVSLLVLLVMGVVVSVRFHRHRTSIALRERASDVAGATTKETIVEMKGGTDEGGGGGKKVKEDDTHETFIQCIKFKLPSSKPALKGKGEKTSGDSGRSTVEDVASEGSKPPAGGAAGVAAPPDPLLPRDDLRAYAYEGEGSSSGSFTSTISDLKVEIGEEATTIIPLVPEFLEVMDLLKNLPEAPNKASLPHHTTGSSLEPSRSPHCPKEPAVSSIVLLKAGASTKPSTVKTRISHLSPSRHKNEAASKAVVVTAAVGEGELATVC